MLSIPSTLKQRLQRAGQQHVLAYWDGLDDTQRQGLLAQLDSLDIEELARLYARRGEAGQVPATEKIRPVPVIPHDHPAADCQRLGEEAIRRGQLAVLVVAGGLGSRLGFEHPKGMYPVGPITKKTLFQIHAEKVLALSRRHGVTIPFLIMTSPQTHDETVTFFNDNRFFGLSADQVAFFQQGTMPALDFNTGRLLMEAPERLFLGPDGHGGTLTALASSGLLARLKQQGIRLLFYFQVDNPLVKIGDPVFLGQHLAVNAEVSSKVIAKRNAAEKTGVFACVDGKCVIVEYSDLPGTLAEATDADGKLRLWAGNPAIHLFDLDFLDGLTRNPDSLPFHIARKKVPCLDESGRLVEPATENALKFERFIFDVLPLASRWIVVETLRSEEFSPLKNDKGDDSPETVEASLRELGATWIKQAGGTVQRDTEGKVSVPIEISPLFALDAAEFVAKVKPGMKVTEAQLFAPG